MKASDFILQTRVELNEKGGKFWSDEEMLIKLQRSYVSLQFDLPFFITKESLAIQSGMTEYYLKYTPLKNINCTVDGVIIDYRDAESFYSGDKSVCYTFNGDQLLLGFVPIKEKTVEIVYRYGKHLENGNCEIETPSIFIKALRFLFMSEIYEKPTGNTKDRSLSFDYLKLYEGELRKLRVNNKMRPRNIKSQYQRI
jgi:hypothetical protein